MNELYNLIVKYGFGAKFRGVLFVVALLLITIHAGVLIVPFLNVFSESQIQHLRLFSNSISNITIAIILMLLVIEGHQSIRAMINKKRGQDYMSIRKQIIEWFSATGSQLFEEEVVTSQPSEMSNILRHFKVEGNYPKLIKLFSYSRQNSELAKAYCENVHFELTSYPSELIYGIHFEFEDYELNERLFEKVNEELALFRQSVDFKVDNIIPKKAQWIFLTRTIILGGAKESDFATILTHARHFVELVGHCYDRVYGKPMVDFYLSLVQKR